MKRQFDFPVGSIIDDMKVVDTSKPYRGSIRYVVKCEKCGRIKSMLGATINRHSGTTHKSCGKGLKLQDKKFHQMWRGLRTRTENPNGEHYDCYGGRGISSDAFALFIDWYDTMYEKYIFACERYGRNNVSIDRIDVNGDYSPENCRFIPVQEQKANQRKSIHGTIRFPDGILRSFPCLGQFLRHNPELGLNYSCMRDLMSGRIFTYKGITVVYSSILVKCND